MRRMTSAPRSASADPAVPSRDFRHGSFRRERFRDDPPAKLFGPKSRPRASTLAMPNPDIASDVAFIAFGVHQLLGAHQMRFAHEIVGGHSITLTTPSFAARYQCHSTHAVQLASLIKPT